MHVSVVTGTGWEGGREEEGVRGVRAGDGLSRDISTLPTVIERCIHISSGAFCRDSEM